MSSKANSSDVVAEINGEPVTMTEFNLQLKDNVASTYEYFKNKYGVDDHKAFWHSTYGGENPLTVIKGKTLDQIKKMKVQQVLAKEKGVVDDISYTSFLSKWKEENNRRQAAVKNNKVIYGPVHYSEKEYYHYVFSTIITKLKENLQSHQEILTSDDVLKRYYEDNKMGFRTSGTKKTEQLSIAYKDDRGRQDAQIGMKMIRDNMAEGRSFTSIMDVVNGTNSAIHASYSQQVWDKNAERLVSRSAPIQLSVIQKLEVGQVSEVFDENGALHILTCMENIAGGYLPFDEVRNGLLETYINVKYDEMINGLYQRAEVKINVNMFNKIKV